ncbi:hypothetical protein ACOMHN_014636 [Nucella lapillus]
MTCWLKYHDLLADYQWSDKQIFELTLPGTNPTPSPTHDHDNTHHGGGPSWGSSGGINSYCHQLNNGLHPYPGDCHKFVMCSFGMSFEMPCPEGTSFSASGAVAEGCVLPADAC